jgi:hypothetical protein
VFDDFIFPIDGVTHHVIQTTLLLVNEMVFH